MNNDLKLKNSTELKQKAEDIKKSAEDIKKSLSKLENIQAKEKCLRVRFLDWLSDKLLDWSNRTHVMASRINSPCLIEISPRTRENSKHFKEQYDLSKLRADLSKTLNYKNNGENK